MPPENIKTNGTQYSGRSALGHMMDVPLLVSSLISHAARHHGATEIASRESDDRIHRYTYAHCERRARQLADALATLGVRTGDRIATLAWNNHRHLEVYYAVSGMGAICHTVNPRLFLEQIVYIINHAQDSYVFFDVSWLPLVRSLAPVCTAVKGWICMESADGMPADGVPNMLCYDDVIELGSRDYVWPQFDELTPSSLCYTSGTTGNPKGVLYSHRSTVLHSYGIALPDALACSAHDVICPIVPMFHANAWGLPYAAPMVGAKLVLPGSRLDGASIVALLESERVTLSAGVPTIWHGVLSYLNERQLRFSALKRVLIGGSSLPPSMMQELMRLGVQTLHAWGMTETSPVGTVSALLAKHLARSESERRATLQKQGRVTFGVDLDLQDGEGQSLPWDGKTAGNLMVRGPWVVDTYYGHAQSSAPDGWFATGDVATIDSDGYLQITDRSKDVIKSGGEWISSIDIENRVAAHPAVHMAACIACPHQRWGERPLLIVVKRPEATVDREAILDWCRQSMPKWSVPEDVIFVPEIPLTATGKMQKLVLREKYGQHVWPEP